MCINSKNEVRKYMLDCNNIMVDISYSWGKDSYYRKYKAETN